MELRCHSRCSSPRGVAGTTVEILEHVGGWVSSMRVVMNQKEEEEGGLCVVFLWLRSVRIYNGVKLES